MVASNLGDMRVANSSFLSVFTLLSEKWSLQQEKCVNFMLAI
jgi:hypothetical protein